MQLFLWAAGSIKGHFKIQLSLFFTHSLPLMTLCLSLSLSSARPRFFSHFSDSPWLSHTSTQTQFSYPLWYCWALVYVVGLAAGCWGVKGRVEQKVEAYLAKNGSSQIKFRGRSLCKRLKLFLTNRSQTYRDFSLMGCFHSPSTFIGQ